MMISVIPLMPILAPLLAVTLSVINFSLRDITKQVWDNEYDFIVVGAGSAGATLAARLSENPNFKVLLLEAGGGETVLTEIPFAAPLLQKTDLDWAYRTVPQTNACKGLKEQRSAWARGKLLGGSSSINYMVYMRGNQRDYDQWAREGCTGWSWKDVFPYFLKSEDQRDPTYMSSGYHATGGPLTVESINIQSPLTHALLESARHLGYKIGDYNGPRQSWYYVQGTTRDGKRCSTAKAFVQPAADRLNLDIVSHALVTKILFEEQSDPVRRRPQARGVQFRRDFLTHQVLARKEVIVAAGAINSPQLLMLSGIGPAQHLRSLGIPVVADLPVGDNLQDHQWTPMPFEAPKDTTIKLVNVLTRSSVIDYTVHKKGPLASLGGFEAIGFAHTSYANKSLDWPDVEIFMNPLTLSTGGPISRRILDLTPELYEKYFKPYFGKDTMGINPMLMRPKSRGTIRLASSDPATDPLIDPKYYSHPEDIKTMIEALKISLAISTAPPLKKFGVKPFKTVIPGCENQKPYSDAYLECLARSYTATLWNPAGTCRMGAINDPRTVVDPELRVKGVGRLRVVDASVMPTIITGHLNAATIMIGEKAADMIKNSNN